MGFYLSRFNTIRRTSYTHIGHSNQQKIYSMKNLAILFLFLYPSTQLLAQNSDSLYKKYNTGLIHMYGSSIMKGNERISFQELSKEFSMSDLGLDQYQISKKKNTVSRILSIVSMAAGLTAISFIRTNRDLALGLLGGQYLCLAVSSTFRRASRQHLDRAILIRNKDYLFPGR